MNIKAVVWAFVAFVTVAFAVFAVAHPVTAALFVGASLTPAFARVIFPRKPKKISERNVSHMTPRYA